MYEKELNSRKDSQILTREFLKKYLSWARAMKAPELTDECVDFAATFY